MYKYNREEEKKSLKELQKIILDSIPGLDKWMDEPLVRFYVDKMMKTGDLNPAPLIIHLLENRKQVIDNFKQYVAVGPPPQYFVVTQEQLDKIKKDGKGL